MTPMTAKIAPKQRMLLFLKKKKQKDFYLFGVTARVGRLPSTQMDNSFLLLFFKKEEFFSSVLALKFKRISGAGH
jgi:hypothetical protein